MVVQTMAGCVCHLFNKSQLNLMCFADVGGDFIQLQTNLQFEPIIYEWFILFVSGTAGRSVAPLTLAHDHILLKIMYVHNVCMYAMYVVIACFHCMYSLYVLI